jgi:glutamyl-tRNA synthetase
VKLLWVNAQYIKQSNNNRLAGLVAQQLVKLGVALDPAAIENHLPHLCALLKDRCDTTVALAQWVAKFYGDVAPDAAELEKHLTDSVRPAISTLTEKLQLCVWDKASIAAAIKDVLAAHGLKMPQLAMPVRVLVMGTAQTPSLDSVLEMCGREKVVERLRKA